MHIKQYYVYIMTNTHNTVLYIGMTGKALPQRIWEHKEKLVEGFTKKYNITKLVYCEVLEDPLAAIVREKQLKAGSRQKKINAIDEMNPTWKDLCNDIV